MKEIKLTQGEVALVDDDMYDYLTQWKWCYGCDGYAVRTERHITISGEKKQNTIYMHREIMNATSGMEVDHRDRRRINNQRSNLRVCTTSQNGCNKFQSNNTSGFKGVAWHKKDKKWRAYIKLNRRQIHLGLFNDKIEAAKVYNAAAMEHHGEFAILNQIPVLP